MLLGLYRACSAALAPLGPLYLRRRGWLRRARPSAAALRRAQERLGRPSAARPSGRLAWIAAARAEDLESLAPLVDRLAAAGFHVLATTPDELEPSPRLPPFALHQYAPLDAPRFCAAFLSSWRPDVALFVGANYPFVLIDETRRRGAPTALVDARAPAGFYRLLRRVPGFARDMLSGFDPCLARSLADADRLRALGAGNAGCAGDPVYDLAPEPADAGLLARLSARIGQRPVWAAFAADAVEAEFVLAAQRAICARLPDALLILAPRRARLGPDALAHARRLGLRAAPFEAEGDAMEAPPQCLLAPVAAAGTLLRAAPVAFLGGGRFEAGREHALNPVGAAKLGCAILFGPNVGGFEEVYAALAEAGGASCVEDAAGLSAEVCLLLHDAAEIREQGRAAAEAVERRAGASARIMQALAPSLAHVFLRPRVEDDAEG